MTQIISVVGAGFDAWQERVERLRWRIFSDAGHLRCPSKWSGRLPFPEDSSAQHFLSVDGGELVGVARINIVNAGSLPADHAWVAALLATSQQTIPFPYGRLSGKAVAIRARGQGVGNSLDTVRLEFADEEGLAALFGYVHDDLFPVWSSRGFKSLTDQSPGPDWHIPTRLHYIHARPPYLGRPRG